MVCSLEEAGRYLEVYKSFESKPPDLIMEKSEGTYMSQVHVAVISYVVATFTPRRSDISGARFTRSPLLASRLPAGCRSALWYTYGSHS